MWDKIKDFLHHKGYIATLLGSFIGFPVAYNLIVKYFRNAEFSYQELVTVSVIMVLAMLWVILPSRISFKGGKFEFTIDD